VPDEPQSYQALPAPKLGKRVLDPTSGRMGTNPLVPAGGALMSRATCMRSAIAPPSRRWGPCGSGKDQHACVTSRAGQCWSALRLSPRPLLFPVAGCQSACV